MKLRLNHSLLAITVSILLASCGGSDNQNRVSSSSRADGNISGSSNQQINLGSLDGDVSSLINNVSNSLNQANQGCRNGQRLTKVIQYSIRNQNYYNNNSNGGLCGNFTAGSMSGQAGQSYVGVSAFSDIMVVSEIINGNQVIGHNVYLSMCSQNLNGAQGIPLISDQRDISGFQMPGNNCIYLNKDNYCPYGKVTSAQNTYMVSAAYNYNNNGYNQYLQPYEIWTTFFAPGCNSNSQY